jgi:hypothetical protein
VRLKHRHVSARRYESATEAVTRLT